MKSMEAQLSRYPEFEVMMCEYREKYEVFKVIAKIRMMQLNSYPYLLN